MQQPEGFVVSGQEGKVCKLIRSLYGLKQAPKQWHEKFDNVIKLFEFMSCDSDKCLCWKNYRDSYIILCLYVDDILIFGKDSSKISETKKFLNENFEMKDLGLANVILGIKISRTSEGITLSQPHYVEKVLNKYYSSECKPVNTPYDSSLKLTKNGGDSVSQLKYSQVIGSLRYLADCTRPDIAYVVGKLSRYTHNPSGIHWHALERVLRYLKGTSEMGVHYTEFAPILEGYSDANWISDLEDIKSTSGYAFTLSGGVLSWKSTKQSIITISIMKAELVALDVARKEAEWLRELLSEIPMLEKPIPAILIHCDNQASIAKIHSKNHNTKNSRHIELRYKILRKLISTGVITVRYVKSADNLADQLTKGLSSIQIQMSSRGMGLKPLSNHH